MATPQPASFDLDRAFVALVGKGDVKVPPYPAVAFRVEGLVRGGDYGIEDLASLVSSDQVLSADVIRCANSVFYSRGTPVASVRQAVQRVGAKEVARVALASGLGAHALRGGPLAALRRRAWVDALASAVLSQALAKGRGLSPDEAFSAALLHDFGKVIAIACLEELIAANAGVPPRTEEEWSAVVERYHVELGVVLAARWELPPVLADVISQHHAEKITATADPRYVETVAAVDEVVALLAGGSHLGAEELEEASLLDPGERELIARTVLGLPAFVASFEAPEAWSEPTASLVVAPSAPAVAPSRVPPHQVTFRSSGREHQYKLVGVSPTQCIVEGAATLPENMLLSFEVRSQPPVKGFASVKLGWKDGARCMLLVRPYALGGAALDGWNALAGGAALAA